MNEVEMTHKDWERQHPDFKRTKRGRKQILSHDIQTGIPCWRFVKIIPREQREGVLP